MPRKSKTEHASTQPQTVAEAEATLHLLQAKHAELQASAEQLAVARREAAFEAHTGSDHRLVSVARAVRENAADIETIGFAIHEAGNRVMIAKAFELEAADKANAAKILETCAQLEKAGRELGDAARTFSETSRQVTGLIAQLHSLGIASPSGEQYRVFGSAALKTMIAGSVWARDYPAIAPGERKTFDGLILGWTQGIRARVRGRIGAKEEIAA